METSNPEPNTSKPISLKYVLRLLRTEVYEKEAVKNAVLEWIYGIRIIPYSELLIWKKDGEEEYLSRYLKIPEIKENYEILSHGKNEDNLFILLERIDSYKNHHFLSEKTSKSHRMVQLPKHSFNRLSMHERALEKE